MLAEESLLVTLVKLVDRIPEPPEPAGRGRGKPRAYSEKLFLKALVVMIVRHLSKVHELLTVWTAPQRPDHGSDQLLPYGCRVRPVIGGGDGCQAGSTAGSSSSGW